MSRQTPALEIVGVWHLFTTLNGCLVEKSCLENAALVAQIIGVLAVICGLIVYYCQWQAMKNQVHEMRKQVDAMERGSQSQNLLSLFQSLQSVRPERKRIFEIRDEIKDLTPEQRSEYWQSDIHKHDTDAAQLVAGNFNVAGLLAENGIVPKEVVVQQWGFTANDLHQLLKEFLDVERARRSPELWQGFDYLVRQWKAAKNVR